MIVTNGRIIVTPDNNLEYLAETMEALAQRAKDVLAVDLELELIEESKDRSYPFINVVTVIEFTDLKKLCLPDIDLHFRAIGNERIQLPEEFIKTFRHKFTPEELKEIASNLANKLSDKEEELGELKRIKAEYTTKINNLDTDIHLNGKLYREKSEERSYNALLHLDFEAKERIFTDKESGVVLHTEPLNAADYSKIIFGDNHLDVDGRAEDEGSDPFAIEEEDGGDLYPGETEAEEEIIDKKSKKKKASKHIEEDTE